MVVTRVEFNLADLQLLSWFECKSNVMNPLLQINTGITGSRILTFFLLHIHEVSGTTMAQYLNKYNNNNALNVCIKYQIYN